jgi:tRNA G18 (ribose-2'-O)-methylase SpoU
VSEPEPVSITDPGDERVADYRSLPERSRWRAPDGVFIAEGWLVVDRLLASTFPVRSVLVVANHTHRLPAYAGPVYVASQAVVDEVVGFRAHRGVLAAATRPPASSVASFIEGATLIAVLEGINDHENLGGIFRNAAAFGLDAVLLSPSCCDPLYRRAVRVSMGHVLTMPFARVEPWPHGLHELRAAGFELVALTPSAPASLSSRPAAPASARPLALLLGAEATGLSEDATQLADRGVRISMAAGVDSLNVATASAIAFFVATAGLTDPGRS